MSRVVEVASGASARLTAGGGGRLAVVCLNGGTGRLRPGDWSATNEWLVGRLSGDLPAVTFVEARYRVKSWRCLDDCIVDARDVLELAVAEGLDRFLLLGFSMGGAVSIAVGDHPAVRTVIGLAPWIPSRLDVSTMRGRRFVAIHGSLDRPLLGIPGVSPAQSKEGVERLRAAGAEASFRRLGGAVHGVALRGPGGILVPLPQARRWQELVAAEVRAELAAMT